MAELFKDAGNISKNLPRYASSREDIVTNDVIREINTYDTWGDIPIPDDMQDLKLVKKDGKIIQDPKAKQTYGVRSIFNRLLLVPHLGNRVREDLNAPLIDSPKTRQNIKMRSNPSIKTLVAASVAGALGRETYSYSDFMYCKYLGRVPNNYLITLRRFPIACNDYIGQLVRRSKEERETQVSLGCMVTWLGTPGNEMSNILKYNYSMPFEEKKAEVQDVETRNPDTPMAKMFAAFDSKYSEQVMLGQADPNPASDIVGKLGMPTVAGLGAGSGSPYGDQLTKKDQNKIYGPVDVVKTTHMRSDKDGLQFSHEFELQFEYELRSYSNINARQAMLDLIANILTVTYVSGSFWRGGFRGLGPHQSDLFSNLKVMKAKGGFTGMMDAFADDLSTIGSKVSANVKEQGGVLETIKNLANNFGGMLLGGLLNKMGRPQKAMLNSLLSPAPVGLWHVTVGNPFHPIMSIGNLILTDTSITHDGPLGLDDFPTKLIVKCKLKRAKGRAAQDIEMLYNQGMVRSYTSMNKDIDTLIKSAPTYRGSGSSSSGNANTTDNAAGRPGVIKRIDDIAGGDLLKRYMYSSDVSNLATASAEWFKGGDSKPSTSKT